jgi:hypothetical protein
MVLNVSRLIQLSNRLRVTMTGELFYSDLNQHQLVMVMIQLSTKLNGYFIILLLCAVVQADESNMIK